MKRNSREIHLHLTLYELAVDFASLRGFTVNDKLVVACDQRWIRLFHGN